MKLWRHQRHVGATAAGFALQIVNTPARPARQGSAMNSLRSALTGWLFIENGGN